MTRVTFCLKHAKKTASESKSRDLTRFTYIHVIMNNYTFVFFHQILGIYLICFLCVTLKIMYCILLLTCVPNAPIVEFSKYHYVFYTEKYRAVMQNVFETFVISKKYFSLLSVLTNIILYFKKKLNFIRNAILLKTTWTTTKFNEEWKIKKMSEKAYLRWLCEWKF